ncbi:MAG TPA: carboxymuconolactone decarboxylase family protein [Methylomirabilota bacterium]|nr:carboxymuconolactone decarboxylase family protein [Methylomirabilota bacterium]
MTAHTAAGKLQGLDEDAYWYEAAHVVGVTNALNVVADAGLGTAGLAAVLAPVEEAEAGPEVAAVFADIRAFYVGAEVPGPFRLAARDPGYLTDLWGAVRQAFTDRRLSRRLKEALAFAVSVTTRSPFGTSFHGRELRRLGVDEAGLLEVLGVTQMFSSYTKIADTLSLEPDMADIAPIDPTPAPGGPARETTR